MAAREIGELITTFPTQSPGFPQLPSIVMWISHAMLCITRRSVVETPTQAWISLRIPYTSSWTQCV